MASNIRNFYISSLSFLKFISGSETLVSVNVSDPDWSRGMNPIRIGSGFSGSLDPDLDSAKWLNTDSESVNPGLESVNPDPESVNPDPESVNSDPKR
jgi:hypothetical protein